MVVCSRPHPRPPPNPLACPPPARAVCWGLPNTSRQCHGQRGQATCHGDTPSTTCQREMPIHGQVLWGTLCSAGLCLLQPLDHRSPSLLIIAPHRSPQPYGNISAVTSAALWGQRKPVPGPALSPRTSLSALWSPATRERRAVYHKA